MEPLKYQEDGCSYRSLLAAVGGAVLAGIVGAWVFPSVQGTFLLNERIVLGAGGAAAVGLVWGVVCALVPCRLTVWPAFGGGFGLGLAPSVVARVMPDHAGSLLGWVAVLVALIVGTLVLARMPFARRWALFVSAAAVLLLGYAAIASFRNPIGSRPGPELVAGSGSTADGPDVLLISIDTLRADALFRPDTPTPNLDALRAESVWADYALAPSGETRPSHTSMLSGIPIAQHGVWTNRSTVPGGLSFVAERFKDAGWRTAAVVSNGVISSTSGLDRGFDTYDDSAVRYGGTVAILRRESGRHTWAGWLVPRAPLDEFVTGTLLGFPLAEAGASSHGRLTTETALEYLDGLIAGEQPYFFFLHYMDPHKPYWPDESVRGSLVDYDTLPKRYRAKQPWKQEVGRMQDDLRSDPDHAEARAGAAVLHRIYDEETAFIDDCIGQVMQRIAAGGRPTVVLFTGDHGESFGEHNLMLHGNSVYGELLRVPFLLRAPGLAPRKLSQPPLLEQVPSTLLKAAGLDDSRLQPPVDAEWSVPPIIISGRQLGAEGDVVPGWEGDGWQIAVRSGDWKLILYAPDIGVEAGELALEPRELYDLANDPGETTNLLDERTDQLSLLMQLADGLKKARRGIEGELSDSERQMLVELGYLDDE